VSAAVGAVACGVGGGALFGCRIGPQPLVLGDQYGVLHDRAPAWGRVLAVVAAGLPLRHTGRRLQFGKPIAGFQLVQDLLVRMLANVVASTAMCVRVSQLQDAGQLRDEHASLAKAFTTVRMRETVGWAREVLGGNGVLLEHHVGRFVADAEAIYSYEGTREINTLIVGRAITGESAFV
jgi:alkylation response protein AidB-like acyl-CoA dehydrogenase